MVLHIDGERLRRERVSRGKTQRDLAYDAKVSVNTIMRLEKGRGFSPSTLYWVAKALQMDARDLIAVDDPPADG